MEKVKVLIVGGGLQAISSGRSLKEAGYLVGLWCPPNDYASKSTSVSFRGYHEDDYDNRALMDFIKKNDISVAIPMSDVYAIQLSRLKDQIYTSMGCLIAIPDFDTLSIAADKEKLMKLCERYNIPHPRTINISETEIKEKDLIFPLLIKPNHSVGSRGITLVTSFNDLLIKLPKIQRKYGDCHLQEYITGDRPYYNVMIYRNHNGEIINTTILEIIRFYPLKGGSSSMCKTIQNHELIEICSRVLDLLDYKGFADFDVLQNEKGEYKIIEINPRVPASLRGAAISGINFPAIIVADALNMELPQYEYRPGKTLRYLGLDIMWFLSSPNRFKSIPSWFKLWGKDVYYQEGGWKDFKPMIYSFIANLNKLTISNGKIRKKSSL